MKKGNEMNKEELRDALKKAYDKLNENEFSDLDDQEEFLLSDYDYKNTKLQIRAHGGVGAAIKWFLIGYFGYELIYCGIMELVFCASPEFLAKLNSDQNLAKFFVGLLFAGVGVGILLAIIVKRKAINKIVKITEEIKMNISELDKMRKERIDKYPEIFGFIPEKYNDKTVIAKILEYLDNMRADNLKEAINLLEQEIATEQYKNEIRQEIDDLYIDSVY